MGEDTRPLLGVPKIRIVRTVHKFLRKFRKKNHCVYKASTLKKCVVAIILLSIVLIIIYSQYIGHSPSYLTGFIQRSTRPEPNIRCGVMNGPRIPQNHDHKTEARLRSYPKVLVFVETMYSKLGRDIAELLVHTRIKYKVEVAGKSLPVLTNLDKGRYGVIVFENFNKYLQMDKWNRELLDKYCREYYVGMIGFITPEEETYVGSQLKGFPLFIHTNLKLKDAALNAASQILRLTRAGETAWGDLPGNDWTVFQANHSTYEPLEWAHRNDDYQPTESNVRTPLPTVIQDHGLFDNIQRVIFGSGLKFWLHRLLFLDSLSYLSHGQLSLSLDRMFLVDIDDIFVGEVGTRLRPEDVKALIATQARIQAMIPRFKFNLGFSGKYFHHGNREEDKGDDLILENIDKFMWFSHMWNHQQPHLYDNLTVLMDDMMLNKNFAKMKGIPVDSGYSVAPHHSGVYPVHELLYTAWKKVWNIRVTSTEEYPHLRPARLRRGFIHKNIMVLPRQTCGLFTHTMLIDKYPGGREKLDESIQGGELFQTIINIFMTHMSNYGNDRLGLYTFESVIKFIQCWTNIKLSSAPPLQLAETYFKFYPGESDPVWGNPCDDSRHQKIWSKNKSCDSLPKFLVIGPQKTGTTALYTFLSLHPAIATHYYFEKSATYFDGELVPKRVHALLPHAKLITILISPAKRAYSWYQHTKAHGDVIANNYSFHQVITASDTAPKPLRDLRNRCLNPGKYAQHLERWLTFFSPQSLHIIDGEELKSNPVEVMNEMQKFLKITPFFNYTDHLRFDPKKGFYCQVISGDHTKCLGRSKGRQYPPMEEKSLKLLQRYYLSHNTALVKLMKRIGIRNIPNWLKDDLSDSST
ncbi:bifunctional heparan sulfate N-deacetylase/N-sulfotransferase [Asbolus verrucosus]|uniref:[heparan sulfate]-glucosamine N-sulfotransferase n=1 Tax=Asbolus verrucosus TaxID=1661398 RepID=A0A482VLH1_ASBVE|nr:bifunctional heparan sulfate N-deacetylase/N-sulfotransferase [Asbolus verrucosus]